MATRSRLSQTAEKKTKTKLFAYLVGIIVILFILVKFGIPALINFSLFLAKVKGGTGTTASSTQQSQSVLLPPTFSIPFTATNSATIILSGTAQIKTTVQLYVNNQMVNEQPVKDDGSFIFHNVALNNGQNTLQAKIKNDKEESNLSDPITVTYLNKQPNLSVDEPHDGDNFPHDNNTVTVHGKTDPDVKVTVNGFWATTDANGNYSYTLSLQNGDNHIKVIATDQAGNTKEQDLTVHYSQ